MQVAEITLCQDHGRAVVALEDAEHRARLTFYADPHEAVRLVRLVRRGPEACHPVFDFVRALLTSLEMGMTRVVLDDVGGHGIGGTVYVRCAGAEVAVPCYPPDALALALRAGVPIYATSAALTHAKSNVADPALTDWLEQVKPDDFG